MFLELICVDLHVSQMTWKFNARSPSSVPGVPLKVCPQGYSCCTVEMEEKLSQQSHTEIKAPVSKLSTSLQSTFKQRHDHFDSKQTHWLTNTCSFSGYVVRLALVSSSQHLCYTFIYFYFFSLLMDTPTCQRTAHSRDSQSVSSGLSTCLLMSLLPVSSSP